MTRDDERDERIAKLLASVRAEAEPALWTRARARIEAGERDRVRGFMAWVMRPVALGTSLAMLGVSMLAAFSLIATTPQTSTTSYTDSLEEALVTELESASTTTGTVSAPAPAAATDSGGAK